MMDDLKARSTTRRDSLSVGMRETQGMGSNKCRHNSRIPPDLWFNTNRPTNVSHQAIRKAARNERG